jgi:hypothetical protein
MRLRVSGQDTGDDYDLDAVSGDAASAMSIPAGGPLNAFAEAICGRDLDAIASARQAVVDCLGEAAMVDAAAVIAGFNAYPRIADATGIPLEDAKHEATAGLRAELGLEALRQASE